MDACYILLELIATILSILGAIFNGAGTGLMNMNLMLIGQAIWVCANGLWIIVCKHDKTKLATFGTFFIAALISTILIIRGFYYG
jgi:hypothetical protein